MHVSLSPDGGPDSNGFGSVRVLVPSQDESLVLGSGLLEVLVSGYESYLSWGTEEEDWVGQEDFCLWGDLPLCGQVTVPELGPPGTDSSRHFLQTLFLTQDLRRLSSFHRQVRNSSNVI